MDKNLLFKSRLNETEVDIDGVGTVRIRALSRDEALQVRGVELPADELERKLLAWALVDPELTEDEVRQWQKASGAGEIETVTKAIVKISGMEEQAPKQAYQQFRG